MSYRDCDDGGLDFVMKNSSSTKNTCQRGGERGGVRGGVLTRPGQLHYSCSGNKKMSVELLPASPPSGNNGSLQATKVGGSKPLHRFMKAQPESVGVVVLVLGVSFFITSIIMAVDHPAHHFWRITPLGYIIGIQFIICGILYIITEHSSTKKIVTASLAFGILTILNCCWIIFNLIPNIENHHFQRQFEIFDLDNITAMEDAIWEPRAEALGFTTEAIFLFYIFVGGIILLVMSVLAGAALRSTKSQATVVMSTTTTETPAH
uniref:uncharacterized protein LOC131139887 n=1 Tax=Doryrhamphus excisus TaxID=161450 RepID=UPI0025ADA972|nr:uncharacterized protein LOC131139887 [Doryrhamphus excisus]